MDMQKYCEEREIGLSELTNIILKRKKIILTIFFIPIITAAIVNFMDYKLHEVNSTIRIGSISVPLLTKQEVIRILQGERLLHSAIHNLKSNITIDSLRNAMRIEDSGDLNFKIIVKNSDRAVALKICTAIANSFVTEGKEKFKEEIMLKKEEITVLENLINDIDEYIEKIRGQFSEDKIKTILADYKYIYELKGEFFSLKNSILKAQDFEIIKQPIFSNRVTKKIKSIIKIAVSGLILGVFIAFLKEFL